MRRDLFNIFMSILSVVALGTPAFAAPSPTLKPDFMAVSNIVPEQQADLLRRGLAAISDEDWPTVRRIEREMVSSPARDVLTWNRARYDVAMSFADLEVALDHLSDWPDTTLIRQNAESRISLSERSPQQVADWFQSHDGPISGPGYLHYAEALDQLGRGDEALEMIVSAWHSKTLTRTLSQRLLERYGDALNSEDHQARVDFLLWTRQTTAASQMKPYLDLDWQALVEARIRLIRRMTQVDRAVAAVPAGLVDHPGLKFERAHWRRRAGIRQGVADLLRTIDGADIPAAGRSRLWREKNIAVRSALKASDWDLAYDLAAYHGMDRGGDFSNAEWMAGWVALRHLGNPELALQHFDSMIEKVSTPISLSRGYYWAGRSHERLGNSVLAEENFAEAAKFPYTYYGQLAAEKNTASEINFEQAEAITELDRAQFLAKPLVQVITLFAENGWSSSVRKFSYHLDDQLQTEQEVQLLAELGAALHYHDIGVRAGKAALAKGLVAPEAAYPIVDYPLLREPDVERPLILALSRQESEMNPNAVSHANARGLMQFVPRTARREANQRGLPFRLSWLTDDPGYNMTLGGAHLDTLLEAFNGSYIMTAAAYNAGASRPRRWVGEYGDPRAGEIDPIDWVEFIPFSETRNYVQRVLENTQVYRHRVSGEPEVVQLSNDLQRGEF
ncbi:MAG: Soluble lytic murein transglycosylase [Hyphomonas sp. TMED17]|nr:MAG: Soluble lytic murein transglycosylase [Hyphomonas sp. TMED17]